MDITAHDVVVQHIRIRPGSAEQGWMSGWDEDGISTIGAYNVIIDHCSLTWGTDENLSASGVQTPWVLLYGWFRLSGGSRDIKAGSYEFAPGTTPRPGR